MTGAPGICIPASSGAAQPIQELSAIISRLIDKEGKITIPGFYDKVQEASAEERTMLAAVPHDDEAYRKSVGAPGLKGEKG